MTPLTEERSASDYIFGEILGEGSFSTVYLAKDVQTNKEYAIKVLEKAQIVREKKTESVLREKEVLLLLGTCQFFVRLHWTFQDAGHLYFVLTYAKNGELLKQINIQKHFNMECTRYYTAELVLALEYLHDKGIVHRDLKPENILFDEHWHILITDFGSAKIIKKDLKKCDKKIDTRFRRHDNFVGTAQYVCPEMLTDSVTSYSSDLWALGCIIYQMVSGIMPFRGDSEYLIFKKIVKLQYEYPKGFNKVARDLIEKLLVISSENRLGASDDKRYVSIRKHELFKGVNWNDLGPPPKMHE